MTYTEPRPGGYGPPPTGHYPPPIPSERFDVGVDYAMNPFPLPDPDSLEGRWDLEGDLARLLQSTGAIPTVPPPAPPSVPTAAPVEDPVHSTGPIPIRSPSPTHVRGRGKRRRVRFRLPTMPWLQMTSLIFAAMTTVIVAMLSVLGGMISYPPLRYLASPSTSESMAAWWPLLVYGPWLVASLSVLRAALHRRGAAHSWAVVVLFSTIAVFLCVAHAPKNAPSMAVAGLPPVAALVSFHQLVRQITLTSPPRHALPRRGGDPRGVIR
ncbi:DUF2637 domain-containing protein [Streptomyces botrytidirepellens]|uniref:DUF2637 domain-containing protein n=1 Tax=Streptomyces botrytidirepellens TaxID=2486417 RepID=A0A3M8X099_9ACTN|nr:DUF2637 domain-containing protein [Streptomyces botrytidirepellens]RNG34650.1 DUF2637 domain-containing protein [Streptomyces botrytidirepellens]